MRLFLLVLVVVLAIPVAASARTTPRIGGPHATFHVSVRVPRTDHDGHAFYARVRVRSGAGCGSGVVRRTRAEAIGNRLSFDLRAPKRGWCPGRYTVALIDEATDNVGAGAYDQCDTPESGSSQCEGTTTTTYDRFATSSFRVVG